MNYSQKRTTSVTHDLIGHSRSQQRLRKLTVGMGSIALLGFFLVPQIAQADTATITGSASGGTTLVANIAPPGVQNTTFNMAAIGPFNFAVYPFFVGTSGVFTATARTPVYQNTTFFLTGLFTPSLTATPATALSNYLVSVYSGNNSPLHTSNFTNLSLTAGQQYTALVAYNYNVFGWLSSSTVTITGVGCISFGTTNLCNTRFVPVANANTGGVASTLDNMSNGDAGMTSAITALSALDSTQRGAALVKLTPIASRGLAAAAQGSMSSAFAQVEQRLNGLRLADGSFNAPLLVSTGAAVSGLSAGDEASTPQGMWLKGYGLDGHQGEKSGFAGYSSSGWGVAVGADRQFSSGLIGGVALSYSDTSVSYNDQLNGDSNGVKSTQISLYGSQDLGRFYVDGILAYAQQRYNSKRDTVVNGYASGHFDGDLWGARIGAGLPIALSGNTSVTPSAHIEWLQIKQSSYTESGGGALALNVGSNSADRLRSSLGAQLEHNTVIGSVNARPFVRAFWNHDFKNDGVNSTASFVGGGSSFVTPGQKLDRDSFSIGAGVNFYAKKDFSATLAYDLTLGSSYRANALQATARWNF